MRELNPWAVRSRGRELHRAKYAAYIQSEQWFARREAWAAAEVDKNPSVDLTCLGCGNAWSLGRDDLHHIDYTRLGHESDSDLWPLCRSCHDHIHLLLDSTRSWRRLNMRQANFLALQILQSR